MANNFRLYSRILKNAPRCTTDKVICEGLPAIVEGVQIAQWKVPVSTIVNESILQDTQMTIRLRELAPARQLIRAACPTITSHMILQA